MRHRSLFALVRVSVRVSIVAASIGVSLTCAGAAFIGDPADSWTLQTIDRMGDARDPSSIDAAVLASKYDSETDTLWLRISAYNRVNPDAFVLQVAVDTGIESSAKMNWWGANKSFTFDRLI